MAGAAGQFPDAETGGSMNPEFRDFRHPRSQGERPHSLRLVRRQILSSGLAAAPAPQGSPLLRAFRRVRGSTPQQRAFARRDLQRSERRGCQLLPRPARFERGPHQSIDPHALQPGRVHRVPGNITGSSGAREGPDILREDSPGLLRPFRKCLTGPLGLLQEKQPPRYVMQCKQMAGRTRGPGGDRRETPEGADRAPAGA